MTTADAARPAGGAEPGGRVDQILQAFAGIYGEVPGWVRALAAASPAALEGYYDLRSASLPDGALPRRYKELILVAINAGRRYEPSMLMHTRGAVQAGAGVAEIIEILLPCILSRGIPAWFTGMKAVELAAELTGEQGAARPGSAGGDGGTADSASFDAAAYFRADLGSVPAWAEALQAASPAAAQAYAALRAVILRDGVLPRWLKELALAGINAAERYPEGFELHARTALRLGATRAQLAETLLVAVLTAGIPAWFTGASLLQELGSGESGT
ncbi:MAG TPA: carboxymuconolactone decarboxylase family protein [Bacillota bacterium]